MQKIILLKPQRSVYGAWPPTFPKAFWAQAMDQWCAPEHAPGPMFRP